MRKVATMNYSTSNHSRNRCILDIETDSLDPKEGRIICVGLKGIKSEAIVFYDENEDYMIRKFLDYYVKEGFNDIIGFNLMFDIRFIFARCMKYEIQATKFFSATFTDIMTILKSVRSIYSYNKAGNLESWLTFLFNEGKTLDNGKIPELYKNGKIQQIIEYNKKDVELTSNLWKRICLVLGK